MAANPIENLARNLAKHARNEPQKAGVLGVLLLIMIVLFVRMGGGSSGPARATASILSPRPAGPDNPRNAGKKGNSAWNALQIWAARAAQPQLNRNLFVVNYECFPQDGSKPAPLRLPQGDGFWDQLAKSMTSRADQKMERDVLVENLRLQAAQLKVQSTMMGATPKALINGELVCEGDVVASFRVSKIEAQRIVVEREGIKLEVRFNQ